MPADDLQADLYELTQERLAAAGLPAYEISNHARPGEACRHNLLYWRSRRMARHRPRRAWPARARRRAPRHGGVAPAQGLARAGRARRQRRTHARRPDARRAGRRSSWSWACASTKAWISRGSSGVAGRHARPPVRPRRARPADRRRPARASRGPARRHRRRPPAPECAARSDPALSWKRRLRVKAAPAAPAHGRPGNQMLTGIRP